MPITEVFTEEEWKTFEKSSETTLDLSLRKCTKVLKEIVALVNSKPEIQTLNLRACGINDESLTILSQLKYVTKLDLRYNNITSPIELLKISSLKTLNLSRNNLSSGAMKTILSTNEYLAKIMGMDVDYSANPAWETFKQELETRRNLAEAKSHEESLAESKEMAVDPSANPGLETFKQEVKISSRTEAKSQSTQTLFYTDRSPRPRVASVTEVGGEESPLNTSTGSESSSSEENSGEFSDTEQAAPIAPS